MRIERVCTWALAVALLAAGCAGPMAATTSLEADRERARQAVAAVVERWHRGLDAGGAEILAEVTARDEELVTFGTDAAERWVGYEALLRAAKAQNEAFRVPEHRARDRVVQLSRSGDVAWFSELLDMVVESGGEVTRVEGMRVTGVLERREGRWVFVQFHSSVPVSGQLVAYPTE